MDGVGAHPHVLTVTLAFSWLLLRFCHSRDEPAPQPTHAAAKIASSMGPIAIRRHTELIREHTG
jgi:hypothetical protein